MNDAIAAIALGRRIDLTREPDFALGDVEIRPTACEVVVGGRPVRLQPRVMQVLFALARTGGETGGEPMSREALMDVCWGQVLVGDDALNRCIQRLRRLAEAEAKGAFVIETIPRLGYRLGRRGAPEERSFEGTGSPAPPDKPSIAVLPFADMTGGDGADYFTDGMVVDIVTALSRFSKLCVIASGTSLTFRNDPRAPALIARELGVRYLLQGSVRRSNRSVRIAVELVDAVEGVQVFADRFDGVLEDVFALQDTVANAVAAQIEPSVVAAETRRANARPTQDLGAYELYLRAMHLVGVQERQALMEAIDLIERAVAMDPGYAVALSQACVCHQLLFIMGWSETPELSRRTALDLAARALRVGGDDPYVLANVASALVFIGEDIEAADALVKRAVDRNPGSWSVWFASAWVNLMAGHAKAALQQSRTALRLHPRSPYRPLILAQIGNALFFLRRFEEAIPLFKEAQTLRPGHKASLLALAATYAHLDRIAEARSAFERLDMTAFDIVIGIFRAPEDRELHRSGLALAAGHI